MTKDESHYLNCLDANCEKAFCVDRRMTIDLREQLRVAVDALDEISNVCVSNVTMCIAADIALQKIEAMKGGA